MKKKLGIKAELLLITAIPLLVLAVVITAYGIRKINSMVNEKIFEGLDMLCTSVYASYNAIDTGDFWMDGDDLYKGDICITANESQIDSYVEGNDADVTLFYGDTRRATSLKSKETGERLVGTQASDTVVESVLKQGEAYYTDSVVINDEQVLCRV